MTAPAGAGADAGAGGSRWYCCCRTTAAPQPWPWPWAGGSPRWGPGRRPGRPSTRRPAPAGPGPDSTGAAEAAAAGLFVVGFWAWAFGCCCGGGDRGVGSNEDGEQDTTGSVSKPEMDPRAYARSHRSIDPISIDGSSPPRQSTWGHFQRPDWDSLRSIHRLDRPGVAGTFSVKTKVQQNNPKGKTTGELTC